MSRALEFTVRVCLGRGRSKEISFNADVSNLEYELLAKCCHEDEEISDYKGLEDLYARVISSAREKIKNCDLFHQNPNEFDDAAYILLMPDEFYDDSNLSK